MPLSPTVSVWTPWRLHADALVAALEDHELAAVVVDEPLTPAGLLVAGAVGPDHGTVVGERRRRGRPTIVWGGTLPSPRVAALRAAGAAGYVSMLASPGDLADVVRDALAGRPFAWLDAGERATPLTPREVEVARAYLVDGAELPRAEVAARMGISERTLKVHVANLRLKAGHAGTATREGLRRTLVVAGWLD